MIIEPLAPETVDRPRTVEATPAEFLDFAKSAHRAGDEQAAREVYENLLELVPDYIEAKHFLGILLCQTGEKDKGLALIESTLRCDLAEPGWWVNYGNVLRGLKRRNEAIDAYKEAITRDPMSADAYSNLGVVQKDKLNFDIAVACFRKAIELAPEHGLAWSNLGNLLVELGQTADGVHALLKSLTTIKTANPKERRILAFALSNLGEIERAKEIYTEWLAEDPDNAFVRHQLAALLGEGPSRASDVYVETLFDSFAENFDEKLANLGYVAPALVTGEVAAALAAPKADRLIADAGCGTGLCGPGLKPFARRLTGVDLSRKMIEQARGRGCYDVLTVAELTSFFATTDERHDVIVSADTLCYFGDLGEVSKAFHRSLLPGGSLVFTVEACLDDESQDFRLNVSGRYAHSEEYIRQVLRTNGFAIPTLRQEVLRKEIGKDVVGYLVRAVA